MRQCRLVPFGGLESVRFDAERGFVRACDCLKSAIKSRPGGRLSASARI